MDGVKVTYIETRFVTSDAAGFKDLVQRLTGRSPAATATGAAPAPAAPHKPRACRATAGPQGYYYQTSSPSPAAQEASVGDAGHLAPPCLHETYGIGDFAGMLYGGVSQDAAQCVPGGSYSRYFQC